MTVNFIGKVKQIKTKLGDSSGHYEKKLVELVEKK